MKAIPPVADWPPLIRWVIGLPIVVLVVVPFLVLCLLIEAILAAAKALEDSTAYRLMALCAIAVVFGNPDRTH